MLLILNQVEVKKKKRFQNSNFEHKLSKSPSEAPKEDDRKTGERRKKQEPEDEPQSWAQEEQKEALPPKPWVDKKHYQAIFRKCISIGEYGEEYYDVIDLLIEAQRAVRRITDQQEIVKQHQKVVRAYNYFGQDFPWVSRGLMQENCWFGDMLKDEKRKRQFKYEGG